MSGVERLFQYSLRLTFSDVISCDFSFVKSVFLADRTNGRAYGTVLRLSVVCRRL